MKTNRIIICCLVLIILMTAVMSACTKSDRINPTERGFAVYTGTNFEDLPEDIHCDILVIDAQYYTSEQMAQIKETRDVKEIYSYLNIGSLEEFRPYFDRFIGITIAPYENWEGEYWVNVADTEWQNYIAGTVAPTLVRGGVDGLFVDNADVYYQYTTDEFYDGVTSILTRLRSWHRPIIINGASEYVTRYLEEDSKSGNLFDGVCQESVFTEVNWNDGSFGISSAENREYYLEYLERVKSAKKDVYLIEYTRDTELAEKIKEECKKLGYMVYVAGGTDL